MVEGQLPLFEEPKEPATVYDDAAVARAISESADRPGIRNAIDEAYIPEAARLGLLDHQVEAAKRRQLGESALTGLDKVRAQKEALRPPKSDDPLTRTLEHTKERYSRLERHWFDDSEVK